MASPNTLIDSDDEYYLNNSVAIREEMDRNIVSLNLEQSDEEDNGRTLSPGFEPSYSPQPSTSWEGHDEVPNYSLEPSQPQGESTVDDDVIFVAAYPAPGPSRPSEDSDIIQVRGPFYPVQGPFLSPPLQGPAVPLNPECSRLPDLVKALNAEFLDLEGARLRLNRNRTPSFFRDSALTIRRYRQRERELELERERQAEISRRVRKIHEDLARRRNTPFYFCKKCPHWKSVKDSL